MQTLPDPQILLPRNDLTIRVDPFHSATDLGTMYRPHGRVRKVTWYQAFGSQPRDRASWELRFVQSFDDDGRCIALEKWSMGFLASRTSVHRKCASQPEYEVDYYGGGTFRTELVEDTAGRLCARMRVVVHPDGSNAPGAVSMLAAEIEHDSAGRVCQEEQYDSTGSTSQVCRWEYDDVGRILRTRMESGRRSWGTTEDFAWGRDGRVNARTTRIDGDPSVRRSSFEYDQRGRLTRQVDAVNGFPVRAQTYGYADDGRLIVRNTWDSRLDPARIPPEMDHLEEVFEGIDRPILRQRCNAFGQPLDSVWWTYDEDSRGNWTRSYCHASPGRGEVDVWREIEYAD